MSEQLTNNFIEALRILEEKRDVELMATLYSEAAKIGNVIAPDQFTGQQGARNFWTEYRGAFESAKSSFRNVIIGDERAALEWTTEGTSFDGKPFQYAGVTLLEFEGNQISRSSAYFDPSALGRQMQE